MTSQEWHLLSELALIVHRMALPDDQRRIDNALTNIQYQEETAVSEAISRLEDTLMEKGE